MISINFKLLRTKLKLSQGELARLLDTHAQTISKYERGEITPSIQIISKLNELYGVNVNWLLFNIGAMFGSDYKGYKYQTTSDIDEHYYQVPLLEDVGAAAGRGEYIDNENSTSTLAFRKDWINSMDVTASALSTIYVTGDSMEPTLKHGDAILVDRCQNIPTADRIFVIRTPDGLIVKRSGGTKGSIMTLLSDNPAIPARGVDLSDEAHIVGRVVWFGREV